MSTPTAELVQRARTGDASAFTLLYERHRGAVRAVALRCGSHQTADDIVQETFTRGMEKLDTLSDPGAFGPWACQIARNLAASGHRRQGRFTALPQWLPWYRRPTAEARQALEAIQALPEAYRDLMMMRLVEQMTGPEIALALGRTPGSVRVSLHRGMTLLRERLGVSE